MSDKPKDTAAAQVGEQKQEVRHIILTQDATIERCARMVQDLLGDDPELGEKIAAAIRHLKDAQ